MAVGVAIGRFVSRRIKKAENTIVFVAALSSLTTGIFSSLTHGTWLGFGIDFFNIASAAISAVLNLYIFQPKTRPVIAEMRIFDRTKNLIMNGAEEVQKSPASVFSQNFWRNVSSTP
ncbi:MAG TPA: hypothetical protein VFA93_01835 [Patescibacteria group bacterium]|nr:hypothetical protein [Patescibacteria group bacterium]